MTKKRSKLLTPPAEAVEANPETKPDVAASEDFQDASKSSENFAAGEFSPEDNEEPLSKANDDARSLDGDDDENDEVGSLSTFDDEFVDEDDVFKEIEIPEPPKEFAEKCRELDPNDEHGILAGAWEAYFRATQQVLLEGEQSAWHAAAVYFYLLTRGWKPGVKPTNVLPVAFPFDLLKIIGVYELSTIEFFDKVARFIEIMSSAKTKRVADYVRRLQETLAVTAVVFKKFLPIFRRLFNYVDDAEARRLILPGSKQIFMLIWVSYLMMKRVLPTEDLLNSFHLLLCIIEAIYGDMCKSGVEEHINAEFAQEMLDSNHTVLEVLCEMFDGVAVDAKEFRENVYEKRRSLPGLPTVWDIRKHCSNGNLFDRLNVGYNTWILRRGQLDERFFVPSVDFRRIFDDAYDVCAVEMMSRSPENRIFEDAQLLLRIATQTCLDRVSDGKFSRPEISNKSKMSTDQLCSFTPVTATVENVARISQLVDGFSRETFEKVFEEMPESPLTTILLSNDVLLGRFDRRVVDEANVNPMFDVVFNSQLPSHKARISTLFLLLVDSIVQAEIQRNKSRCDDLLVVLRREEFLTSTFAIALELVLFSHSSQRRFPWSAQLCDLHPLNFHKIIDVVVVANEKNLSCSMVQHLNKLEEMILEELAWTAESPLWKMLEETPLFHMDRFDESWFDKDSSPLQFTPLKKRRLEDGDVDSPSPSPTPTATSVESSGHPMPRALRFFIKRVYYAAVLRLNDLCDRVRMEEKSRSLVWTLWEYVFRSHTSLMLNRHLDQNLLCCVYVVSKIEKIDTSFTEIMAHYRRQPQAASRVYRQVFVEHIAAQATDDASLKKMKSKDTATDLDIRMGSEERKMTSSRETTPEFTTSGGIRGQFVDIIRYYNDVFRVRVEDFVGLMDSTPKVVETLTMPVPRNVSYASPLKRNISSRIMVQTLQKGVITANNLGQNLPDVLNGGGPPPSRKIFSFSFQRSPRKDLRSINQEISKVNRIYKRARANFQMSAPKDEQS